MSRQLKCTKIPLKLGISYPLEDCSSQLYANIVPASPASECEHCKREGGDSLVSFLMKVCEVVKGLNCVWAHLGAQSSKKSKGNFLYTCIKEHIRTGSLSKSV